MSKVSITRSLLDDLAMSISAKSGEAVPMTLTEMKDAVDSIQGGGTTIDPLSVTANGTYTAQSGHAYSPVTVSVPTPTPSLQSKTKTYTPTTSQQTESVSADSGYDGLDTVSITVNAMPTGTAGTPTATKGSVSNHSISVTPSVTNTTGYITGSTKTGTAVTVSASELVSGTKTITENGTGIDVSTYENVDVNVPSSEPNIGSLTVTPSTTDQVFTGAYPGINLGVLSFRKTGTSASFSIDLSEIEYGETYHIQCDLMTVGNDGQYYNYIKIDTDWVASENGTVPFEYISHASWNVTSIKLSKSAITVAVSTGRSTIVNIGGAYTPTDFIVSKAGTVDGYKPVTVNAMPSGTAGTPTATKGTVSNHQVSVTPSVTNTTGYITGSTKTGTAVTVSASELVSGNLPITQNGNNIDCANYSTVSVNVPSGSSKNAQVVQSTTRTSASALTAIGAELTVSKTGTYDIYYSCFRTNTSSSYTWATRLYINGTAYGTAENATWTNNQQNTHLSNISLTTGDKLRVYGRNTRGTSYYICAPMLVIVEA